MRILSTKMKAFCVYSLYFRWHSAYTQYAYGGFLGILSVKLETFWVYSVHNKMTPVTAFLLNYTEYTQDVSNFILSICRKAP